MKKTITSAGLVMLGAVSLHAQRTAYAPAPGLSSTELSKWWSVSASLRGFYDDNYTTAPSRSPGKRESFGFEASPSAAINWTLPQTYLGLSYIYGFRWYDDRRTHQYDQVHQANAKLSHAFNEHYKIDIADSFVSAQEPEIIDRTGGVITVPLRSEGDNIRNTVSGTFTADLTEHIGVVLGYTNNYYDYDQRGTGSYSALLDRVEHLGTANLRWQLAPSTVGILGYQYGVVDYNSPDFLSPFSTLRGRDRNNHSHYGYLGLDHNFNSQLQTSLRVGAQYTEYDHFHNDSVSPYADASVTYTYNPGSYLLLGVRHARNATDIAFISGTTPTLDEETTTVYGSLNHKLTAKLTGSVLAQMQYSQFERGGASGEAEIFLLTGVNLTYDINRFLSAEAGYNYDRLDSDISNRSYTRNRVYIGVRASY